MSQIWVCRGCDRVREVDDDGHCVECRRAQQRLVTDGGEIDESGPSGTLILSDEPARPLRWHHSVEFDGYKHTTACSRVIDCDDIRDVFLDPVDEWNKRVKPANSCPTCHDSVHQRGEFNAE
ncbi:hypothetical protein [Halalkalirubrum salinum]|uniref:hypothetical protein n=1 Tax=Halalkalirubrum salinum TaxID=2563889 RepID=UPI0010FB4CC8|nr:hypothetical protein [Halalkalirubrum salinum]